MTEITLDVAAYQDKAYESPRCWKLVADVYANTVGRSPDEVQTVSENMRRAARAFRLELHKDASGMQQLEEPCDLCVVLMWATVKQKRAHCGIYWKGSVLHATETGTLYQDLFSIRGAYSVVEFWARADA